MTLSAVQSPVSAGVPADGEARDKDLARGTPEAVEVEFRPASLDGLDLLLADVRGALGPYLNVFLVSEQHWSQSEVGLVTTIGGILGLIVQTPIGAAIDATRAKRALIIGALTVLALGGALIAAWPS